MTLDESYLAYPRRQRGQDIERYDWSPMEGRAAAKLAGDVKLAVSIVVPIEYFPLTPSGKPFRHPGAMVTPYPDLRHYTTRDYGNRVGAFRLLKAFAEAGVKATFAVNAILLDRSRPLIDAILADGHEIAAHGLSTDHIHHGGLTEAEERAYTDKTRAAFEAAGLRPRTWMSPARQESTRTPDLVRAAGFDICLDWEFDVAPVGLRTSCGPLVAFPLLSELDDRTLLTIKNHDESRWRDQIIEAAKYMRDEAATRGAECLSFTMTPYVAGQPFRMWAVKEILAALGAIDGASVVPVATHVDNFSTGNPQQ
ncbi:MAG: polysaccharide deacetylase family protein [Alphaproteobacteria bacterium]|nr:polysaccharide deacetylase family protein [Alphaproteobacteria bacterium]